MNTRFAAVHESAFGTKQTSEADESMSAIGGKADIANEDRRIAHCDAGWESAVKCLHFE
jgi:hypothetical protein